MNQLNVELDRRMRNWAYWIISFKKNEVGFPNRSTIADFGMDGSLQPRHSKPPFSLQGVELADQMNGWLNIMGVHHPDYKSAIIRYYLTRFKISELAKQVNIHPHTFKDRLRDARTWLKGRLSAEENISKIALVESLPKCHD